MDNLKSQLFKNPFLHSLSANHKIAKCSVFFYNGNRDFLTCQTISCNQTRYAAANTHNMECKIGIHNDPLFSGTAKCGKWLNVKRKEWMMSSKRRLFAVLFVIEILFKI